MFLLINFISISYFKSVICIANVSKSILQTRPKCIMYSLHFIFPIFTSCVQYNNMLHVFMQYSDYLKRISPYEAAGNRVTLIHDFWTSIALI